MSNIPIEKNGEEKNQSKSKLEQEIIELLNIYDYLHQSDSLIACLPDNERRFGS